MTDDARVERVTTDDLAAVKAIRLRALRDAPYAFASTLEHEAAMPEREWRSRLDSGDWYLASRGCRAVGMVASFGEADGHDRHLVAMWVEPAERGTATAAALVDAVLAAARRDGAGAVRLWVADGNTRARRLYERCGFRPTGLRQPLPSDPSVGEEQMVCPLESPGGT